MKNKFIELIENAEYGNVFTAEKNEDRDYRIKIVEELIREGYPIEFSSKNKYEFRKIPYEHLNKCKCGSRMANKDTYIYGDGFLCEKCWNKIKVKEYR